MYSGLAERLGNSPILSTYHLFSNPHPLLPNFMTVGPPYTRVDVEVDFRLIYSRAPGKVRSTKVGGLPGFVLSPETAG